MRQEKFDGMLRQVYATFGRTPPVGDVRAVIWDKIRDVPDEAAPFLADQLCNRDELPRNVARALTEAWGAWKSANPARIVREHCPHCLDEGVFHCWAQEPGNGRWHKFAVPCPYCQTPEDGSRVPADLRAMKAAGVDIMPPDYAGGPVAYDRWRGYGCLWPADLDTSTPRPQMRVGVDMRQDARRVRHIPARERQDTVPAEHW